MMLHFTFVFDQENVERDIQWIPLPGCSKELGFKNRQGPRISPL